MSFSSELKTELCALKSPVCCRKAECYAVMLFGQSFSADKISLLSHTPAVIQNFNYLAKKCFGVRPTLSSPAAELPPTKAVIFAPDSKKIFTDLEITEDNIINPEIYKDECCSAAFLRGAFVACGQMQSPEKGFRIDFRIKNKNSTEALTHILSEKGILHSVSKRDKYDLLYIKKSESVQDTVTIMGAGAVTLKLIDEQMIKELRNDTNRRANIEVSNLSKVVESSLKQRAAIEKIIKSGRFDTLPDNLQELCLLRMGNPEASLKDLCRLYSSPVTRSALNNMLNKLLDTANKL